MRYCKIAMFVSAVLLLTWAAHGDIFGVAVSDSAVFCGLAIGKLGLS
jgi:hypothetical protein